MQKGTSPGCAPRSPPGRCPRCRSGPRSPGHWACRRSSSNSRRPSAAARRAPGWPGGSPRPSACSSPARAPARDRGPRRRSLHVEILQHLPAHLLPAHRESRTARSRPVPAVPRRQQQAVDDAVDHLAGRRGKLGGHRQVRQQQAGEVAPAQPLFEEQAWLGGTAAPPLGLEVEAGIEVDLVALRLLAQALAAVAQAGELAACSAVFSRCAGRPGAVADRRDLIGCAAARNSPAGAAADSPTHQAGFSRAGGRSS